MYKNNLFSLIRIYCSAGDYEMVTEIFPARSPLVPLSAIYINSSNTDLLPPYFTAELRTF